MPTKTTSLSPESTFFPVYLTVFVWNESLGHMFRTRGRLEILNQNFVMSHGRYASLNLDTMANLIKTALLSRFGLDLHAGELLGNDSSFERSN